MLCQLYFRSVFGSYGSWTVMSDIYRILSRVSQVFYGSTLVGYIVSLETQQRSVSMCIAFIIHPSWFYPSLLIYISRYCNHGESILDSSSIDRGCQHDCVKLRLSYTRIRCDDDEDDLHSITHPGDSEEARFIRGSRAFSFGIH